MNIFGSEKKSITNATAFLKLLLIQLFACQIIANTNNSSINFLLVYDGQFQDQISTINFALLTNKRKRPKLTFELLQLPQNGTLHSHLTINKVMNYYNNNNNNNNSNSSNGISNSISSNINTISKNQNNQSVIFLFTEHGDLLSRFLERHQGNGEKESESGSLLLSFGSSVNQLVSSLIRTIYLTTFDCD